MKKIVSALMCAVIALVFSISAFAAPLAQSIETIHFDDGSYSIIETTVEDSVQVGRANTSVTASDTYTHYNQSGKKVWTFKLTATFAYNGKTSKATRASVTSSISDSSWSLDGKTSYCSGDTAYGDGSYSGPGGSYDVSLSLSCDENGNIS